jgi:hypothetical protein
MVFPSGLSIGSALSLFLHAVDEQKERLGSQYSGRKLFIARR